MHTFLLLLTTLLFGALWGAVQGMIMIQPKDKMAVNPEAANYQLGVRNHRWYGIFHRMCLYCAFAGGELVLLCVTSPVWDLNDLAIDLFQLLIFGAGAVVLGWEASESAYSFTRYGTWIGNRETVVFADFHSVTLSREDTVQLHLYRIVIGLGFVIVTLFG